MFNLCNKAGWWIHIRGWRDNDHSRNHSVDALKWLPACSSSFYSVHIYSKNHGYFIKHFFKCLGSFCVTQIIGQSQQPRVCICIECTQIFCLLFWWEQFPVRLTYLVKKKKKKHTLLNMQNYNNPDTNVFHWRKRIRQMRWSEFRDADPDRVCSD